MNRRWSPVRWIVPLCVLALWVGAACLLRWMMLSGRFPLVERLGNPGEDDPFEIGQAVLLGAAGVLCVWALVRSGPRRADFYWWLFPAFVCLFMCWRELEIDKMLVDEHAFSWSYLWEADTELTLAARLALAVPSLAISLFVLVACLRHAPMLLAAVKGRNVRLAVCLFTAGIGCYLVGQVYDRGHGLRTEHGIELPGFRRHRDDFWEEALEMAGALCIVLAAADSTRRRPIIPGTVRQARAALAARPRRPAVRPRPEADATPNAPRIARGVPASRSPASPHPASRPADPDVPEPSPASN